MVSRHPNIWTWLLAVAFVAMSLRVFAPLPTTLDKVLSGVAIASWLVYISAYFWEDRRKRQEDQSSSTAISSSDQM